MVYDPHFQQRPTSSDSKKFEIHPQATSPIRKTMNKRRITSVLVIVDMTIFGATGATVFGHTGRPWGRLVVVVGIKFHRILTQTS